ncbi:hypothetical protein QYE76_043787 [Lolium multiflorum]|uniref:CCHC-type domain-containing protein n=1 Tax=Lolium multiflorum TaxID=4521 RepID=A0AAD8WWD1_LOLMU|nr:hypothetical protein QYE76_043787 [Lolium multiflorum]
MNLTRREVVDDQLNTTAINMIHMAVTPKDRAHIRSLKTAKEAWDKLDKLFLGNESIQSSRFDEVNNMADNFVMNEGETPEEMYRRLIALAVQMQDLGATFVDDHWIKRKFYNALLPYEEVKLTAIRQNASFRAMTSDEVLSEVIALDISKKNAEDLVARAHNVRKPNLALKMKVHEASESDEDPIEWGPDDLKTNYHEHMALAAKSFWSGNKTRSSRPRRYSPHDSSRYSPTSPREEQRGRVCFNCGDTSHFVADCIFERREDHGGRLVRKDKCKSLSKGFSKFSSNFGDSKASFTEKTRAFIIREEYSSDEGEENKDKGMYKEEREVDAIAISTPYISIFNSPNENLIVNNFHCLVAKVSSETHDEEFVIQLDVAQDHVEADVEIVSLTQAYEEEWCLRMSLETSAMVLEDSNNYLVSQLIKDQDYALERYYRPRYRVSTGSSRPRGGGKVKPSSRRHRDEDEQEEIVPARLTKRQREPAAGKRTAQGPRKSMVDLKKSQFLEVRGANPYLLPRNARQCPNNFFYHVNQERIYNEVYGAKEFNCCPQYSISMDKLNSNLEYFGEALEICVEQGIDQLMTFSHNYSKEVICQFYATVVFLEDEGGFRSLKWMTREHLMEATWQDFARGIGYELNDYDTNVFRIHLQAKPMAKEKMANLYIPGRMLCGSAKNLLPVYDIMNRIYRSTINPKHTNHDEVHGFLVNLLVRTHEMRGRGKQLDVMDYIWHEMRDCAFLRKLPQYAPYIMRLICLKWEQEGRGNLLEQCHPITIHKEKSPLVKNHDLPRFGKGAPKDKDEDEADSDDSDYVPNSVKTKGLFAKLTARLKKSFCFKRDLEDRMYQAHHDNKKIRQRQKAMMRHDTSPTNPSKEIFSELDEIKTQVPIFPRSFQKTEGESKWGHEVATPQGGAAQALAAPAYGVGPRAAS